MALVRDITQTTKERYTVHDEVECLASTFTEHGHAYLQLETFGRPDRKIPGKVSQSIQFDRAGAARLKQLLERVFPGI
jgi:hypothetical protein